MIKKSLALVALLCAGLPAALSGQARGLEAACASVVGAVRNPCFVAAQAIDAVQPSLGLLLAGGNPTIGTGTGGLRVGVLPRVSAAAKVNLITARIPDLASARIAANDAVTYDDLTIVAPALSGTVTVQLLPGFDVAPTLGGIGSVDLLGTAAWLPLEALGSDQFRAGTATTSWGVGARLGLLRESFTAPGVALSVMHHRLGEVAYGEICPGGVATSTVDGPGYRLEEGECVVPGGDGGFGDLGEFAVDLRNWSTRAVVSKHFLGFGLAAGLGYDRLASAVSLGARSHENSPVPPGGAYVRITDADLSQGRLSAFVNGSFSILAATFALEAGWLQGGDALTGFPASQSDFDPGESSYFGSVGLRVAL